MFYSVTYSVISYQSKKVKSEIKENIFIILICIHLDSLPQHREVEPPFPDFSFSQYNRKNIIHSLLLLVKLTL